jgi:hypothetical protein
MRKFDGGFSTDTLTLKKSGKRLLNHTRKELSEYYNDHWHIFGNKPIDYEMTKEEAHCRGECNSGEPQLYTDQPREKPKLEWIELSQEKPKYMTYVLVFIKKDNSRPYITIGRLTIFGEKWFLLEDKDTIDKFRYYDQDSVSHWMPLPEKPE